MTSITKKISAIIVDDESSARKSLAAFITSYCPTIQLVGEAEDIHKAQALIKASEPQLVFLDIEMPGGNAFDLLEQVEALNFEIIFVTAYSEYALRAFEMSASNYLLKPLSIDALVEAVEKVTHQINQADELNSNRILLENINLSNAQKQKIVLPLIDGFELATLTDVVYISAMDNFSQVHLANKKKITVCRKLKYFEELLSPLGFFRIHRSHIVNREYVQRYHKGKGGYVILTNDMELDVAQSRKVEFLRQFGLK